MTHLEVQLPNPAAASANRTAHRPACAEATTGLGWGDLDGAFSGLWSVRALRLSLLRAGVAGALGLVAAACSSPLGAGHGDNASSSPSPTASDTQAGVCSAPAKLDLFDSTTKTILQPADFTSDAIADICTSSNFFVFVGNADSMGTIEFLRPVPGPIQAAVKAQFASAQTAFSQAVNRAAGDLADALQVNDCLTLYDQAFERERAANSLPPLGGSGATSYDALKQTTINNIIKKQRVLLATLIDGPNNGDSSIETRWYGWTQSTSGSPQWGIKDQRSWQWNTTSAALEATTGAFELNLPRSLSAIIKQLMILTPAGQFVTTVPPQDSNADPNTLPGFNRVNYFFKTHGGLYTMDSTRHPDLLNRATPGDAQQVLLFDAHGDQGEVVSSDLYSPFWTKQTACQLYRELGNDALYASDQCAAYEQAAAQGDVDEISQNITAGVDTGGCSNTAGSGKGLLFDQTTMPVASSGADVTDPTQLELLPEGVIRMGEALTYSSNAQLPYGIGQLQLSPASSANATTIYQADMIVLDSCYGSDKVGNALLAALQNWPRPLVTISNPNPLYIDLLQYNQLSLVDYVALPSTFVAGALYQNAQKSPSPSTANDPYLQAGAESLQKLGAVADSLTKHFAGGLDPQGDDGSDAAFRQIFPDVLFLNYNQ